MLQSFFLFRISLEPMPVYVEFFAINKLMEINNLFLWQLDINQILEEIIKTNGFSNQMKWS